MPSIAEYKREILLRKKLKSNPLEVIQNNLGEDKFGSYFFKGMEDVVKKITEVAIKDLLSNEKMVSAIADLAFKKMRKPVKGIDYKDGEDGYTPKKGIDYKDGKDGYTPKKGVDYFTDKEIADVLKKATPKKGVDYFTKKDIEYIKILAKPILGIDYEIEKGKDATELQGEDIVNRINNLAIDPNKQIDASHIKGLPKLEKEMRKGVELFRGGLKLIWNIQLEGIVDGTNATFTIPGNYPEPKDGKIIISARGVLKDEASGDFTISGRTITFVGIPPLGSEQPRVVLYHGK